MIDERYLRVAVQIRRTYLKLINNMELYKTVATSINKKLEETIDRISEIENEYIDRKIDDKKSMDQALKVINEIEEEGKRLEGLINPINDEIEKLLKEEQELYKQIVNNHRELTEQQIVSIVRDRLIKEGLS